MRENSKSFICPFVLLAVVMAAVVLSGCASSGGTSSGPTQAQLAQAGIKSASGLACLKVAEKHHDRLDAYSADLAVASTALVEGKTYDVIRALVLKNANLSPEEVVIVSPALDLLDTYFQGQAGGLNVAPAKGSDAYLAVKAALDGCKGGLAAGVSAGVSR